MKKLKNFKQLENKVAKDVLNDALCRTLKKEHPEVIKLLQDEKVKDIREDLAEVLNNLSDDLGVDEDEAQSSYKTKDLNKARIKAINKYTYKITCKKFKKYGGKLYMD